MKLAIHAGSLRGAGSATVGRRLIEALAQRTDCEPTVWCPREWRLDLPGVRSHPTLPGLGHKFVVENWAIPRQIRRSRFDALLSLTDTSSLFPPAPHVLFVQQAFLAYLPSDLPFSPPRRFRAKMLAMSSYFAAGMRGVDRFVVQTQDMRSRLAARWRIPVDKIVVVPSAVDDAVLAARAQAPWHSARNLDLFYPSGAGPHKNHLLLAATLAALPDPKPRLRVTIAPGEAPEFDAACHRLKVAHLVDYLGRIDRGEILARLGRAGLVVIPTLLESFGLSFYEALALGCPVVAADTAFSREACGTAARFAPCVPEAFAAEIHQVLSSENDRRLLGEAAYQRFAAVHVPWSEIASRYVGILKEAS